MFLIATALETAAQSYASVLQSLVDAERAFAQRSKDTNTKQAFLDFLAPDATLLNAGSEINGIELWKTREVGTGLLFWEPVFVDIASSEDFGYTYGPFYVYKNRTDTEPAFKGYYSTIWGKQSDGTWKVLFDLGGGVPENDNRVLATSGIKLKANKIKPNPEEGLKELLAFDKAYVGILNSKGTSFDPTYFSTEGRIHRAGRVPVIGLDKIKPYKEESRKFELTHLSGRIASSTDMGYTYGKTKVTVTADGKETVRDLSYFRIWKKEDGKNWKVVLDVIGQ